MATSSRWLHHLRLSPLSSLRDVWRRIDLLQQYVLLDYVRAEADKKLDDTSRQALIAELEAAREAFRCQLLRDRMGDDRVSSGWSGSIIKGDLVFANYSNWGWWPCKLVGIRAAKDRVQVEIYFFPGYSNPLTPSQPVTEWSKDWVDAEQVCSFLENFSNSAGPFLPRVHVRMVFARPERSTGVLRRDRNAARRGGPRQRRLVDEAGWCSRWARPCSGHQNVSGGAPCWTASRSSSSRGGCNSPAIPWRFPFPPSSHFLRWTARQSDGRRRFKQRDGSGARGCSASYLHGAGGG